MKKVICMILALVILLALCACGEDFVWTREGAFVDEEMNVVSIDYLDNEDQKGWYVSVMLGEKGYGEFVPQEGKTLHGALSSEEDGDIVVTISEDGEKGIKLAVEGGKTYTLAPYQLPANPFTVTINTEGLGEVAVAEKNEEITFDPERPMHSFELNMAAPETVTIGAKANDGWKFVKWTRDGEDYSTDAIVKAELGENAEFVAVFASITAEPVVTEDEAAPAETEETAPVEPVTEEFVTAEAETGELD